MRRVELDAVITAAAAENVFENVVRFERYSDLAPHVQSATVQQSLPEPTGRSSWELHFRSGLLRWTENETFDTVGLTVAFEQESGDFDSFTGVWSFTQQGADTAVNFVADFDFGIPSLEGILDPIAERVIRETVAWALVGLFEHVDFAGTVELVPAANAS